MIREIYDYLVARANYVRDTVQAWAMTYTLAEWLLHLVSISAGLTCTGVFAYWASAYRTIQHIVDRLESDGKPVMRTIQPNQGLVWVFGVVSVVLFVFFSILFVTHCYAGWITWLSQWLHQRRFAQRYPRWHVANSTMNLSAVFVKNIRLSPVLLICSVSITVVAMISRAHQRRDPSGLTEGLTTCYFISFLTFYAEVVITHLPKISLLITSLITTILCLFCSISPDEEVIPVPDMETGPMGPPPPPHSSVENLRKIESDFNQKIEEIKTGHSTTVERLEGSIATLSTRVSALESTRSAEVRSLEGQINRLTQQLETQSAAASTEIRRLDDQINGLTEQLETQSEEASTEVRRLEGRINNLTQQLRTRSTEARVLEGRIDSLRLTRTADIRRLEAQRTDIRGLEAQIVNLRFTQATEVSRLQTQIDNLEMELDTESTKVRRLERQLDCYC